MKPHCIFCEAKNIWLYCSEDGTGICEVCIKLAVLSLMDKTRVINDAKFLLEEVVNR